MPRAMLSVLLDDQESTQKFHSNDYVEIRTDAYLGERGVIESASLTTEGWQYRILTPFAIVWVYQRDLIAAEAG